MGGKSSLSSVASEHQRNENSVPFPACASEKNRSLFFRAASQDRCTESGSGQQNRGRNFVPTLCEGVAFRYSLLHYPFQGVHQSYALIAAFVLGAGRQDNLTGRVENWATN